MNTDELKRALDKLTPDDGTKERMLARILSEKDVEKNAVKPAHGKRIPRTLLAVAACFVVLIGTTVSIDAATDGGVRRVLGGLFGQNTNTGEVVSEAELAISHNMIYAPDIIYLDRETLLFSTGRGIIVYDRVYDTLSQTIDLQQTDCIYWNSDAGEHPVRSHALYDDGILYVFNEKDGEEVNGLYRYDLTGGEDAAEAVHLTDPAEFKRVCEKWNTNEGLYTDTFDAFEEIGLGEARRHPNDQLLYSERSYRYTDANGEDNLCYLTVPTDENGNPTENIYRLNLYRASDDHASELTLRMTDTGDTTETTAEKDTALPPFAYTGDDPAIGAICDYMLASYSDWYMDNGEDDKVMIPAFVIHGQVERDNVLYVFGNYWMFSYYLNGHTLETASGGESPARIALTATADGYEVTEELRTGDGSEYEKGIRDFTEGFDGMYEKFFSPDYEAAEADREDVRKAFIRMYNEANDLGIEYYKDYGWEPVAIND